MTKTTALSTKVLLMSKRRSLLLPKYCTSRSLKREVGYANKSTTTGSVNPLRRTIEKRPSKSERREIAKAEKAKKASKAGYVVAMETESPLQDSSRFKELVRLIAELAANATRVAKKSESKTRDSKRSATPLRTRRES